jgi:uncharacterized metal-binding protein YceD (DUF177 family)
MAELLRIADLNPKRPVRFEIVPTPAELKQIAQDLDLTSLRKMRFKGTLTARGKRDWELEADLGATVVQACVVSLEPVTTRLEEKIQRRYLADFDEPEDDNDETTLDDTAEPLPVTLDLKDVATEALALALPLFPRSEGAELSETVITEAGADPLTADKLKPFAGLADLKKKLEG